MNIPYHSAIVAGAYKSSFGRPDDPILIEEDVLAWTAPPKKECERFQPDYGVSTPQLNIIAGVKAVPYAIREVQVSSSSAPEGIGKGLEGGIRSLIQSGMLREARLFMSLAVSLGQLTPILRKYQMLLEPPTAKDAGPGTGAGRLQVRAWLHEHAAQYRGQWVAFVSGHFIGSNVSRLTLRKEIAKTSALGNSEFLFVPVE